MLCPFLKTSFHSDIRPECATKGPCVVQTEFCPSCAPIIVMPGSGVPLKGMRHTKFCLWDNSSMILFLGESIQWDWPLEARLLHSFQLFAVRIPRHGLGSKKLDHLINLGSGICFILPIGLGSTEGSSKVHIAADTIPDPYTIVWRTVPGDLGMVWPLRFACCGLAYFGWLSWLHDHIRRVLVGRKRGRVHQFGKGKVCGMRGSNIN